MNENQQLGFLDILSLISFAIQLQNQGNIIRISDVQSEVDRAVDQINLHLQEQDAHLHEQDRKLKLIMDKLGIKE